MPGEEEVDLGGVAATPSLELAAILDEVRRAVLAVDASTVEYRLPRDITLATVGGPRRPST